LLRPEGCAFRQIITHGVLIKGFAMSDTPGKQLMDFITEELLIKHCGSEMGHALP